MPSLIEWLLSAIAFVGALAASWVIISIFLGTMLWIADEKPRDPWWVHFIEILRMPLHD
jgi:hypothetical protein